MGCNTVGFISKHISHAAVEVNRDHQVSGIVSLWWFLGKKMVLRPFVIFSYLERDR
jgi:hypothetical protein